MRKTIVVILTSALILSSCGSSKDLADNRGGKTPKNPNGNVLSSNNKVAAERLFFDAQKEKLIGNIAESATLFKQSIKLNPALDASYYELAQIELAQGKYDGAQKYVNDALEIDPTNPYYLEFMGNLFAAQSDYEAAANIYDKLIESNPEKVTYYLKKGFFLARDGQLKAALELYDNLESKIGLQDNIAVERHKIYIRMNKLDDAANELEKLIEAKPGQPDYLNMLAEFYVVNGMDDKAVKQYKQIIDLFPDNANAITSLADYYKAKGNEEEYMKYSKMAFGNYAIPIDAKIAVLYNQIQYFEEKKDNIDHAFELADILMEKHSDDAKSFAISGDLRNLNNEPLKALDLYNKSLDLQKDIFSVWQQVFFIQSDQKDFDALLQKTQEAKEYFPNQPTVYFFNGLAHQQKKDFEKAAKAYEKGVKMTIDNTVLKAQLHSNLGEVYNTLEKYAESDKNFSAALDLEPNNPSVLNNYSYYLSLRSQQLDKAAEMSKKSNDLDPDNPSYLDTYAWVLYKQGKFEEALKWQDKAIEAAEIPSPTVLEHYGDMLFQLNRVEEAVEYWNKALSAGSTSPILPKKIADKQVYE